LQVAKARHSYRLRPGLARSGKRCLPADLRAFRGDAVAYARARSLRTLRSSTG
jgi:hypothetical protein